MRFLRTASTGRLLAVLASIVVICGGGAAIAVAAVGSGPVPGRASLPAAVHRALSAAPVRGISADITFTDNLVDSSDFAGGSSDPVLQGASGRLWISDDGRLRLELQSNDGDAQVVLGHGRFLLSDPAEHTTYEGALPAMGGTDSTHGGGVPTIARISALLTRLSARLEVSGAQPTDVAGRPAYRVSIAPRTGGGLLGSVRLAWDAVHGVPLSFDVYARGNPTPVLGLTATHVAYGAIPASTLDVAPPAGNRVVSLSPSGGERSPARSGAGHSAVSGAAAVARRLPFALRAPAELAGLPRHTVTLLRGGAHAAALLTYGKGLDGIAVIESAGSSEPMSSGGRLGRLTLPSVSIDGASAQELSTPLGTILHVTRGGVSDTVIGSVPAATAETAARGL